MIDHNTRLILTDVDDTLCDFSSAIQQFLAEEHGMVSSEPLRAHHNLPKLYDITIERTLELVAEFHLSDRMRTMEPEPCAKAVLPELYKRGYRFVAISACLDDPRTVRNRVHNLERNFGFEFEEVHCMGLVRCKKAVLEMYAPAIWVDDLYRHAHTGAELGHRTFLMDRAHNRHQNHPDVTRVADWHEIAAAL